MKALVDLAALGLVALYYYKDETSASRSIGEMAWVNSIVS
jgi:hypothetical protein